MSFSVYGLIKKKIISAYKNSNTTIRACSSACIESNDGKYLSEAVYSFCCSSDGCNRAENTRFSYNYFFFLLMAIFMCSYYF